MGDMKRISKVGLFSVALAVGGTALAFNIRSRRARGPWQVHDVSVPSTDGTVLRGYLRLPDGPGPHPGVVLLHGGRGGSPLRASVMARSRVAAGLLAAGYAVISAGFRRHAWMRGEVDDAVAAYHYLAAHPRVDADRIAFLGNSHGGAIALVAAPRTAAKAIVEYCAPTDAEPMVRFLTSSSLRARNPLVREAMDDLKAITGGTFDECPEVYRAMSPAYRVWEIQCPVLIVHGSRDGLVPVTHAYILRDALEAAEKPHEMHIFPRMPHSFPFQNRPEAADAITRTVAFLASSLQRPVQR